MIATDIPFPIMKRFKRGTVIPAMPLALNAQRKLDERRQRALIRYYLDAGSGGIAVGVHSTQFEIRDPEIGLYEPILKLCSAEIDGWTEKKSYNVIKIAGVSGKTEQALQEAAMAGQNGYHACLISLSAFKDESIGEMVTHCREIAEVMPVIGFYLQPSVGGRILPYEFWYAFAKIDNVIGIKIAPFNRYQTIDVVRAVAEAGGDSNITLYTGNDDTIVSDLLTRFRIRRSGSDVTIRMKGGLLGHWGFWTKRAVELLEQIHAIVENERAIPLSLLATAAEITDVNGAVFDPAHTFAGCIPGIHEMLRRQGLLEGRWCLNENETLSPGQMEEIERVHRSYPHLNDYEFVRQHIHEWLEDIE